MKELCHKHAYGGAGYLLTNCPYCRIEQLEQQLAHKQEQCDQLAHEVLELEYTLKETENSRDQAIAQVKYFIKDQEVKFNKIVELESRYAGAVEVEGYLDLGGDLHIGRQKFQNIHGNVKVLVMKEVE